MDTNITMAESWLQRITLNISNTQHQTLNIDRNMTTPFVPARLAYDNREALEMTRFVVQRILVPIVVLFGAVGNTASIVVLTHKSMKTSTNCYLTALAVFDALYLIMTFVLSLKHYDDLYEKEVFCYIYIVARVMGDMFSNVSVCLTVTFTVERWIAVCHPMKGRVICTYNRARIIAAVVSITTMMCIIPECFEWKVVSKTNELNQTIFKVRPTAFANTEAYSVGFYWFLVVCFTFVPLISLCFFNTILILSVYRASRLRRRMTYISVQRPGKQQHVEQNRITCMLIGIALVFILCQTPTAVMIIYWAYISISEIDLSRYEINSLTIAANFTNLLLSINAAINFLLYSAMSTKFRKLFMKIFCNRFPGRKGLKSTTDYSYVTGMSYIKRSSGRAVYGSRNSMDEVRYIAHNNLPRKRHQTHGTTYINSFREDKTVEPTSTGSSGNQVTFQDTII